MDEGTPERHGAAGCPLSEVKTGSSSAIDLRPNPSWEPVEREAGNMQHLNVAVDGVDDIQVIAAKLASIG